MDNDPNDVGVLTHIQRLVDEEHLLFNKQASTASESERLAAIEVELDRCWDLLRQRRALREMRKDPAEAQARPADIVEKYVG